MGNNSFYPTRDEFPTTCDNCGVEIDTERYRGKGVPDEDRPHGHEDPRHAFGAYCSVECSKEDDERDGGTIYGEK